MVDDLHFMKDIHISRKKSLARSIATAMAFCDAIRLNRTLFVLYFTAVLFVSLSVNLLFAGGLSFAGGILSFILGSMFFFAVTSGLAKRISYRCRSKLYTGFRDVWAFAAVFNLYLVCLIPVFHTMIGRVFWTVTATVSAVLFVMALFYRKKIIPGKQPDLDIPCMLDADEPVDMCANEDVEYKKIQINGDTRNAFILSPDKEIELTVSGKTKNVKFAVGMRESSSKTALKGGTVRVFDINRDLIFSRSINTVSDHTSRGWIDISIEAPLPEGEEKRTFFVSFQSRGPSDGKDQKNVLCLSEIRKSNNGNPRKLIFIVVDALRADHVGCYGYGRSITGNIDKLAEESVKFRSAFVQGDWTLPAFMSMLTGMYPSGHHVYHHSRYHRLDGDIPTLPGILRKNGFFTRCFFTHKRLMSHFGFAKGFDSHIFRQCDKEWGIADADDVTNNAIDVLDHHKDDDLFLMIHYFDTHQPCMAPSPFSGMFDKTYDKKMIENVRQTLLDKTGLKFSDRDVQNLIARYDEEIYKVDMRIGMLLDHLKATGQYEDSMIVVTADHGMLLNDHGELAKIELFDETLHVPLIMKLPGGSAGGSELDDIVEASIDIMPTMLSAYGLSVPGNVQGRSLLPLMQNGERAGRQEYAISESLFQDQYSVSLRDKDRRYIFSTEFNISEFKNFKKDIAGERFFEAGRMVPCEMEIPLSGDSLDGYRDIVNAHIKKQLEINGRV